jgi:AraC-like DNA-binding protein
MELQTHGQKKYPASALLKSSTGLGSTISAELRSHGIGETPVVVPQHTELCLAVLGNDNAFVRRTGAGQCQQTRATTGTIWLAPIGVGDNEIRISAPIPKTMHLYLPMTQIALNARFSSQASFTRAFRRARGATPAQYRRRRRLYLSRDFVGHTGGAVQIDRNTPAIKSRARP